MNKIDYEAILQKELKKFCRARGLSVMEKKGFPPFYKQAAINAMKSVSKSIQKAQKQTLTSTKDRLTAPNIKTVSGRIAIVNLIIEEISCHSRRFFYLAATGRVAFIVQKGNKFFYADEYKQRYICITTKFGYPPRTWWHGGTLWGLLKDFCDFIKTGVPSNGKNGYGGLNSDNWGYSTADMKIIRHKAIELGYLTN